VPRSGEETCDRTVRSSPALFLKPWSRSSTRCCLPRVVDAPMASGTPEGWRSSETTVLRILNTPTSSPTTSASRLMSNVAPRGRPSSVRLMRRLEQRRFAEPPELSQTALSPPCSSGPRQSRQMKRFVRPDKLTAASASRRPAARASCWSVRTNDQGHDRGHVGRGSSRMWDIVALEGLYEASPVPPMPRGLAVQPRT
jgi:hypothetical protein